MKELMTFIMRKFGTILVQAPTKKDHFGAFLHQIATIIWAMAFGRCCLQRLVSLQNVDKSERRISRAEHSSSGRFSKYIYKYIICFIIYGQ